MEEAKDASYESHILGHDSDWIKDFAGEYDFCMVFPVENGGFSDKGRSYITALRKLDFEMYAYKGVRPDKEIYVLIRAPLEKLRAFADKIDFQMKLDATVIQKMLEKGDPEANIAPIKIPHRPDVTPLLPYEQIYGQYSRNVPEAMYWREPGTDHPFREIVRLKLCALLLESRDGDGATNLNIRRSIAKGHLLGCFPLHDRARTQALGIEWDVFPWRQLPLYYIKEYFGEKIAVYFAFMQHFTTALAIPAFVGLPIQIAVWVTGNNSAPFLPVFSFCIALWAVCMLEFWKRKEKTTAMEWGTINYESDEMDRPDFRGEWIDSFVDGSKMRYYPSRSRNKHFKKSISVVGFLILLVLGCVASIYVVRFTIVNDIGTIGAQVVASVANAVQIQVLNYIYTSMAMRFTEKENHRTDTQFEDSMIMKIFLFQFVNSYASFFYLAFVAKSMGDCPKTGCMGALGTNLAIVFGARIVVAQLKQNVIPYFKYQRRMEQKLELAEGKMTRPEKELQLDEYDQMGSSLEDYAEIAVGFGYTALFVTALPIAAFFELLANIAEIKTDGWKLIHLHARPFPKGCEDIGTWQTIFLLLSIISVVTNAGLTVFTMNTLDGYTDHTRYWIFVLFQWICFTLQVTIMEAIPDVPEAIDIQLERSAFITRKLIDRVADDNDRDIVGHSEPLEIKDYPDFGGVYTHEIQKLDTDQVHVYHWRSL